MGAHGHKMSGSTIYTSLWQQRCWLQRYVAEGMDSEFYQRQRFYFYVEPSESGRMKRCHVVEAFSHRWFMDPVRTPTLFASIKSYTKFTHVI